MSSVDPAITTAIDDANRRNQAMMKLEPQRADKPAPTIMLNEPNPKAGDTVTFTCVGGRYIVLAVYGDTAMDAQRKEVGQNFVLPFKGEAYAWLDRDRDMSNGYLALERFVVTAA